MKHICAFIFGAVDRSYNGKITHISENRYNSTYRTSVGKLHSTAIFSPIKFHLYKRIYDYLPENTLVEKIFKVIMTNNLDRKEFGEAIGHYWSSVQQWELNEIYPKPNTIKDICDIFNVDLKYFGDYYYWVFNDPGEKFKEFKEREQSKK